MNITFFEVTPEEKAYFQNHIKGHTLQFFEEPLSQAHTGLLKETQILCTFIYSTINKNVLEKMPRLQAIITRSTGYDHIDLKVSKKKGIPSYNVPYYGENTVAEHTFALILDLSRKIHRSYERTVRGNFSLEGLKGFDLKEKTIGIIGYGHIGKHVARIAKGFSMNILVYDPHKQQDKQVSFVPLTTLLKKSDIITLHCPHNKKTHHLINQNNIRLTKKGAILINTARGGIIETKALVQNLANKHLGGAGLDVLEEESIIKEELQLLSKHYPQEELEHMIENHLLLTFDHVIITPHNAFNSYEALQRILDVTTENIKAVTNNKKGRNRIL